MAVASSGESLSEQLREVLTVWASSQWQLVQLAADFADSNEWTTSESPTAAHWIASLADIEVCTAREWIRIGRRLRGLPMISEAFASSQLSYSKVRTLTRVANPENEAELLEIARGVPAGHLNRALAAWLKRTLDPDELDAYHQSRRSVRWRLEPDGMVLFSLRLPPLLAAKLIAVLVLLVARCQPRTTPRRKLATESGQSASAGTWPSLAQQHADALEQLLDDGTGTVDTEVIIHVRGDGCSLDDGTPITDTVAADIASESFIRLLIHDAERNPINASRRQRHPTTRQKRVVRARDQACVDCGGTELLIYDHDPPFEESGQTVVEELKIRCAPCHHARHNGPPEG